MTRRVPPHQLELVPARCRLRVGMLVRIPNTRLVFQIAKLKDRGETVVADRDFFPGVGSPTRSYVADGLVIEPRDG